jgi:transposase
VSNVLSEQIKKQVIALGQLGWSLRQIQKATGVRRETAGAYLKAAGESIRPPGSWGKKAPAKPANEVTTDPPEAKPANGVTTGSAADPAAETPRPPIPPLTQGPTAASVSEPYRELILNGLARGRNAMSIFQEMVDRHGFPGAYESVKRFVRKLRGTASPDPRAVIITEPGQEAQVDYGTGPTIRDPNSGKYRRSRLFVMTLGYSRKCVRLLTFQSSTRIWAELHELAFRKLGGAVKIVVPDNLREGILKPDLYDATLNPLYRDVLAHYGAVAMPCRVGDPDRKGKVESGVGHAQKTPLKAQRFESMEEAQAYLDQWEERWADTRIHGTTKRQVSAMFAEEKPSLLPLPLEPFRYYQYGERTVHLDGCVEVEAAYYSAPPGWIGRKVQVQWDGRYVRLLDPRNGQLLREHLRGERGRHRIKEEDRPQRTPIGVVQLLARMATAGESIGQLSKLIYAQQGEPGVRRIQGILSFAKKYGLARVEDACAAALEMEAIDYRFVRRYLERNSQPPLSLKQVDPLIRQLNLYRQFIEERTQDQPKEKE